MDPVLIMPQRLGRGWISVLAHILIHLLPRLLGCQPFIHQLSNSQPVPALCFPCSGVGFSPQDSVYFLRREPVRLSSLSFIGDSGVKNLPYRSDPPVFGLDIFVFLLPQQLFE
jgi:hypothetical protein